MSQFAVIGLGRFGSLVARNLFDSDHDVLAIDANTAAVQRARDFTSQAVVMDARDKERLSALGVHNADVVILSLGDRIEASAIVALHLKELGARRVVAKAASEELAKLLRLIGVDEIISPEEQAAERLANRLRDGSILDYIPLGQGYTIVETTPPKEFLDHTLIELRLRNRFNIQVLALRDTITDQWVVNPPADFRILAHHVVVVLGANADLDRLRQLER